MKTIFITLFQGVEAKNILRTGVFAELMRSPGIRLVCFVGTPERAARYRQEFPDPRVVYEVAHYAPQGRLDRLFGWLKFHLFRTATTDLRRQMNLDATGSYAAYVLGIAFNRLLARPSVRRAVRWIDFHFVRNNSFSRFFETYKPDAVLLAHLFDDGEIAILREAKRRGVPTVGFINSWDKLTARAALRLLPDRLLVYNDIVKREAMTHADMPESRITVVGIPQYDHYHDHRLAARGKFLRRIGIDPRKRFFLYAPIGETFSNSDWDIIDLLRRWVSAGTLPADVDFLVRFQPNDFVDEAEIAKRPWLHYDRPGVRFTKERGVDWDMSGAELRHLADTLSHAALLVCYASSLSVNAAVFGKPVINIGFEITPRVRLRKSPTQFYAMEHYRNALQSGGIRLVQDKEELLQWLHRYLEDPRVDSPGRARLVAEQCSFSDGQAGARIARAVLAAAGVRRA